jgi:hypothetical protein
LIAMSAYTIRTERSQINALMLHVKLLEEQEQANSKTSKKGRNNNNKGWNQWNRKNKQTKPYKELMKQKAGSLKK